MAFENTLLIGILLSLMNGMNEFVLWEKVELRLLLEIVLQAVFCTLIPAIPCSYSIQLSQSDLPNEIWYSFQSGSQLTTLNSKPLLQSTTRTSFIHMKHSYFPIVKNNLSPTSPSPGLIMPHSLTFSSRPATHISTPSSHSHAALNTPGIAPKTAITITLLTPHSFSVCIAAAQVPPVAITGSRRMASSLEEEFGLLEGVLAAGRW